jgi:hypothetical protein
VAPVGDTNTGLEVQQPDYFSRIQLMVVGDFPQQLGQGSNLERAVPRSTDVIFPELLSNQDNVAARLSDAGLAQLR